MSKIEKRKPKFEKGELTNLKVYKRQCKDMQEFTEPMRRMLYPYLYN